METPEPFHANTHRLTPEKRLSESKTDHFIVDDLLIDFPNDDMVVEDGAYVGDAIAGTPTDSSTAVDSCNSSSLCGGVEPSFAGDMGCLSFIDTQMSNLCVPYDEFEWLTNVVEESFSNEDMQKLQLLSGIKPPSQHQSQQRPTTINQSNNLNSIFNIDMSVPGKARTKRSRAPASCNWVSPLLVTSPTTSKESSGIVSNNSPGNKNTTKKENEEGRKCLHCATGKTPQWRTGPMGPKTLCNACGVRYKSGRLVPEYRPAASPTFVLTKHSNSHRKVLELRRQKEMQKSQRGFLNHQNIMVHIPNGDDYLIHQHIGPDYRQLI